MPAVSQLYVGLDETIQEAMRRISSAAASGLPSGIALVVDEQETLIGVVTDGDIRRGLLAGRSLRDHVATFAVRDPIVFSARLSYREILDELPKRIVEKGRYRGGVVEKIILVDERQRVERVLDFIELWRNQNMRHRHVTVVGLGFVGLTLAATLADSGFPVTGVERDPDVRNSLAEGAPHIFEAGLEPMLRHHLGKNLTIRGELPQDAEVHVLAVPTPLGGDGRADLRFLTAATEDVAAVLGYGDLVIVRSTVPVGTTRQIVLPILESRCGLRCGRDFCLAFAPERTIAGRALAELRTLPQIVGGFDQNATDLTAALFREVTPSIVAVNSLEEAEMAKLVNNSFRDVSFAYSNELAIICEHYKMDAGRVINAANDGYPRGHVAQPSPGVGGVCLKKDPYMFIEVAHAAGLTPCLSEIGRRVNELMPERLVGKLLRALARLNKIPGDCRFFLIGFAFKGEPETSDMRDSTTLDVLKHLQPIAREIRGTDPVVSAEEIAKLGVRVCDIAEGFAGADCAVIMNNHRSYAAIDIFKCLASMNHPAVYCDCWGILSPEDLGNIRGITHLGLSTPV